MKVGPPWPMDGDPSLGYEKIEHCISAYWRLNPKVLQKYIFDEAGIAESDILEGKSFGTYLEDLSPEELEADYDEDKLSMDNNNIKRADSSSTRTNP
jgi:hypothetical protein